MTREEKIKLAIEKGFTYDIDTGKIYGVRGKEVISRIQGYVSIQFTKCGKKYELKGHQFAYYIIHNKIVDYIDHRDGDRTNNKIDNLREVTNQQNCFNRIGTKGYFFDKERNKFLAQIKVNKDKIYLGRFDTELEARNAYLEAKEKYHLI